ncbi:unnamed protein product [Ranitomeya imitator]|uniref:ZP domain-containing protein n=1 Tax=Ranitomeya imitator TaxID=111125 RepID=A0ABN9LLH0_9NEOB|nr:unnamed protein product [Ranitomeya imitator]
MCSLVTKLPALTVSAGRKAEHSGDVTAVLCFTAGAHSQCGKLTARDVPDTGIYYGQPSSRQLSQPPTSPINVQCGEDRMVVSVNRDFYGNGNQLKPSDLSLGSCSPGSQVLDPMVVFDNDVQACGSNLQVSPEFLIYRNVLNYNPVSPSSVIVRSNPAAVPIVCFYPRHGNVSSKAVMPTWAPFTTTVSTEERLVFSIYLMTGKLNSRCGWLSHI